MKWKNVGIAFVAFWVIEIALIVIDYLQEYKYYVFSYTECLIIGTLFFFFTLILCELYDLKESLDTHEERNPK